MNTKTILVIATVASLLLVGCQATKPPEHPINTGDRARVGKHIVAPEDEILPTLKISEDSGTREIKLRSQTSRFLDDSHKTMKITLSSSRIAFCENETPALQEGEEQLVITIKSKDTAITSGATTDKEGYELSGVFKNSDGEKILTAENFKDLNISDLNNAIARGHLNISAKGMKIEGEFFTAICK